MNTSVIRNPEEMKAKRFLESQGFSDIKYEPLGNNSPPDFEIEKNIAVEVRRLNQYIFHEEINNKEKDNLKNESRLEPIEKATNTLNRSLKKVLREFDSSKSDISYWISFHYKRPIEIKKAIIRNLRLRLNEFLESEVIFPYEIRIFDNLFIRIIKRPILSRQKFWVASESDRDIGGWSFQVVDKYVNSISHCILDKEKKIEKFVCKYDIWWLILVDTILGGAHPSGDEIIEIKTRSNRSNIFKKIIVISYQDELKVLEY